MESVQLAVAIGCNYEWNEEAGVPKVRHLALGTHVRHPPPCTRHQSFLFFSFLVTPPIALKMIYRPTAGFSARVLYGICPIEAQYLQ